MPRRVRPPPPGWPGGDAGLDLHAVFARPSHSTLRPAPCYQSRCESFPDEEGAMSRAGLIGAVLLAVALSLLPLAGCGAKKKIVTVDGSSTVFPVTEAVAEEFQKEK